MWLAALLLLTACGKEPPVYQEQGFVFGTMVDVTIYGAEETQSRQAVKDVMQEFQRLHDTYHAWQPSELSALNAAFAKGERKAVSPELAAMLQDAAHLSAQSGGVFNPAIGGLIDAWGFQADEFKPVLPDEEKIAALVKANPQMSDLVFSLNPSRPPLVRGGEKAAASSPDKEGEGFQVGSRNPAVQIDLGGYAKGYALDRAAVLLKQRGINNALINIGGNIMALGQHGKRPWRVGIQHPRKSGALAMLALHDGEAVGTSGDYQRYFELDGGRYCHLIDPRNGQPTQGVQAVTIITQGTRAGLLSDASSKPLFISGAKDWRAAAQRMNVAEAMLVDSGGNIQLTAAMQKRLEFADKQVRIEVIP